MCKKTCAFLFLFSLITLSGWEAFASIKKLNLDNTSQSFQIGEHSFILQDKEANLSVQDVILKYRNNAIKINNNTNLINFTADSGATWIITPIQNSTNKEKWILDLGSLSAGRSGIINKYIIYEANQRNTFLDGTTSTNRLQIEGNQKKVTKITLPAQKESLLIFYITPAPYKKLTLNPSLISDNGYFDNNANFTPVAFIEKSIAGILIISLAIIFTGFFITKLTGLVPLLVYYALLYFWYSYVESNVFVPLIAINTLASIFPILLGVLVLLSCLLIIPQNYSHSHLRLMIIIMIGVNIFTSLFISAFNFPLITQSAILPQTLYILSLLVCVLFLIRNKIKFYRPLILCLLGWIGCILFAEIISTLAVNNYIEASFLTLQADRISLFFQFTFVFAGVLIAIRGEHTRQMSAIIRQTQKTQYLLKAKKDKDETDHSRLLRVIEREREIMEELRDRESERTEEMREAKNAADQANQAKSAFLAIVSHEIRTPMTGVMGMLRMLENTEMSEQQKEYLYTIKDSGDSMLALLNDILDFSKIEGGGLDLETIQFDLKRTMNGVTMLMKAHAEQKNIDFRLNMDGSAPTQLYGDPTRLRQILLNLIGNAIKFTQKGSVIVSVESLNETDIEANYHSLKFSVTDTGIGISAEAMKNLFTPFSQADSSITRKYGGTGLGLSICKKLVEAMGGDISVQSVEGRGTTFSFVLKLATTQETYSDKTVHVGKELSITPKKFLVVDDNEINRKVVSGFLTRDGHKSQSTGNPKDVMDILKKTPDFDAVFLDIEMPEISGVELAKIILSTPETQHIKLVAITGNVSQSDLNIYRKAGFHKHVAKPIEPDELRHAILTLSMVTEEPNTSNQKEELIPTATIETNTVRKTQKHSLGKTLDEKLLKGLKEGLGSAQTAELINDLFIKATEIVGQFNDAIEKNSKIDCRMRAHEMRGMTANFGLKALSEKSAEIESIAKDLERPTSDIIPHIKDLETLIERSKYAVKDFLGTDLGSLQ